MKLFLTLSFLGTRYAGYQVQPRALTVQQALNEAALALFGFDCDIVGCSRTDAGVHARMFCVTVSKKGCNDLPTDIPVNKMSRAFSQHLPDDISVYDALFVDGTFHPRYDVISKEYEYRFHLQSSRDPFTAGRCWQYPAKLPADAADRMQRACRFLTGTHDFTAFMAQGSKIKDATRTVFYAGMSENEDGLTVFRVRADGFLYHMVRIMAGTLLDVAAGRLTPEQLPDIIASRDRSRAGRTAPACGLYLSRVDYGDALTAHRVDSDREAPG